MKEGNTAGMVGALVITAVVLILGLILLTASAQQVGDVTNTRVLANQSLGTLTNGTPLYVTNCRALSSVIIFNATGDVSVASTNYTVTNNILHPTTSALAVRIDPQVTAGYAEAWNRGVATIDAVCQPLTYDNNSGGRAIAGIIVILFAVALAVVALSPTLRSDILNAMGR